jgi:hypothetical protein
VTIRNYRPGDETAQAAIFNAAAGSLPGCKPASVDDLRRRAQAPSFDPNLWFYADEGGEIVGYCSAQPNGRIGFPWCKPGSERLAEPLLAAALDGLRARGTGRAYAAYAASWTAQADFFLAHEFVRAREIVNFVQELTNLPTLLLQTHAGVSPLEPADIPAVMAMTPELWRDRTAADLRKDWFENPQAPADSLFAVRSRVDREPIAVGRLIENPSYADPTKVDATQPCFRLGAFGTEGLTHKRINGLFSLILPRSRNAMAGALDLLAHAAARHDSSNTRTLAAQASSDTPHLVTFYQSHFQRQASFPVFERTLSS